MSSAREDVERMIADELRSYHQKTGAWVKAMAETEGDFERARMRYREIRLAELCAERDGDKHWSVRTELRYELERQGRASIYSILGLPADASEREFASAIAARISRGEPLDAGVRYAIEVVGDEGRRAEYDRQLLDELRAPKLKQEAVPEVDLRAVSRSVVSAPSETGSESRYSKTPASRSPASSSSP